MIRSFRHKGLKAFYEKGSNAGIQPKHAPRLRMILSFLEAATESQHMDKPGLNLHPLKGNRKGEWAVTVNGNWRVTFRFVDGAAEVVDYLDYH